MFSFHEHQKCENSGSESDNGEEIDSVNCESISEEEGSAISSLIDDRSVDSCADRRARIELGVLTGRLSRPSDEAVRLLVESSRRNKKTKGRRLRKFTVQEPSEEEKEKDRSPRRYRRGRPFIMEETCEDVVTQKEGESVLVDQKKKLGTQFIHVKHPLSELKDAGEVVEFASVDESGMKKQRADSKAKKLSSGGAMGKGDDTSFQVQTIGSPSLTAVAKPAAAVSPGKQYKLKQISKGENPFFDLEKLKNMCAKGAGEEAVVLLSELFNSGKESFVDRPKSSLTQRTSTMSAVEGYNPVVDRNVKVSYESKWHLSKGLTKQFQELLLMIEHGEGFNPDASSKLLSWQKELVFEGVIGQANREKARDHWTKLKHAINLGKKDQFTEHYERLMYCLFMQECTHVLPTGELFMTKNLQMPERSKGVLMHGQAKNVASKHLLPQLATQQQFTRNDAVASYELLHERNNIHPVGYEVNNGAGGMPRNEPYHDNKVYYETKVDGVMPGRNYAMMGNENNGVKHVRSGRGSEGSDENYSHMRSGVYHCAQGRSNAINGNEDNGVSYGRGGQTSDFRQHAMRDGGNDWSKNRYGMFCFVVVAVSCCCGISCCCYCEKRSVRKWFPDNNSIWKARCDFFDGAQR